MDWTTSENASWLTIETGGSGTNNGIILILCETNYSDDSRTGTITITASDAINSPLTVEVRQSASACADAEPVLISYTPDLTSDLTPGLEWKSVLGATDYKIQISDQSSFANLIVEAYTSDITNYTPSSELPTGNIYWRVSSSLDYSCPISLYTFYSVKFVNYN